MIITLTDFLESLPAEQRDSLPKYKIVKLRTNEYKPMIQSVIGVNAYEPLVWIRSSRFGGYSLEFHHNIDVVKEAIIEKYKEILDKNFPQVVEEGP